MYFFVSTSTHRGARRESTQKYDLRHTESSPGSRRGHEVATVLQLYFYVSTRYSSVRAGTILPCEYDRFSVVRENCNNILGF